MDRVPDLGGEANKRVADFMHSWLKGDSSGGMSSHLGRPDRAIARIQKLQPIESSL